jgi:hypothetical protein
MTLSNLHVITWDDVAFEGLRIRYEREKAALIQLIRDNEAAGRDAGAQLFGRLASQRRVVNSLGAQYESAIAERKARADHATLE